MQQNLIEKMQQVLILRNLLKKDELASLKSKVDKLHIGKLKTTSAHLSWLNNVVEKNVVNQTEYNELVKKVNAIQTTDTGNLVKKSDYNTKIEKIEKKLLIMTCILLLNNLISYLQKILQQD